MELWAIFLARPSAIAQAVSDKALKDRDCLGEKRQNGLFAWAGKCAVSFHLVKKLREEKLNSWLKNFVTCYNTHVVVVKLESKLVTVTMHN